MAKHGQMIAHFWPTNCPYDKSYGEMPRRSPEPFRRAQGPEQVEGLVERAKAGSALQLFSPSPSQSPIRA